MKPLIVTMTGAIWGVCLLWVLPDRGAGVHLVLSAWAGKDKPVIKGA